MVVPHLPPSPRLSPRNLCLSRGRWLDEEEEGGGLAPQTGWRSSSVGGWVGVVQSSSVSAHHRGRLEHPRPVRPPADYRLAAQSTPAACVSGLCALKSAKI